MPKNYMTTTDKFPTYDITHKPKRMQGESIPKPDPDLGETPSEPNHENIPKMVTLEKAIVYFETNAIGEYRVLYLQTAKWLREHLTRRESTSREVD